MINQVALTGRLTKDIEIRMTASNKKYAQFTIAVDRFANGQKQADFIPCVAWEKSAELLAQYCKKGSLIGVTGSIRTRNYQDPNTQKKVYVTEVLAENITFLSSRNDNQPSNESAPVEFGADDLPF